MAPAAADNVQIDDEYLFVYGTLRVSYARLPTSIRNMRPPQILQSGHQWRGTAQVDGYLLYDLGPYPGVVAATRGAVVHGDLFALKKGDLPSLDAYEGITPGFDAPQEYARVRVHVCRDGGKPDAATVPAWLYVYNWPIPPGAVLINDGEYVEYCSHL